MEKSLNKSITCENRSKIRRNKISVFGPTLRAHNQPCVRKQDYAHAGFCLETLETQQTEQGFKTQIITT